MVKKKLDIPDIPWEQLSPEFIRALAPVIQGVAWVGLSRIDPKIEQLNSIIALAEVIPNVDIGLPPGVVLGAMYDKQEEALEIIVKVAESIGNLPTAITDELEKLRETLIETKLQEGCLAIGGTWDGKHCTLPEFEKDKGVIWPPEYEEQSKKDRLNSAIEDCVRNGKKELGIWAYTLIPLAGWGYSCLLQKGFDVTLDFVKKHPIVIGALL